MSTWRRAFALILLLAVCPATARAQVSLGGGVTAGGEVTATFGAHDDEDHDLKPGYFNYTDYAHNALRMFRVSLSGMWHPIDQVAFLAEVRSENVERVIPYAMYVRVRPWKNHPFDIQAGRIPAVFGAYARRYGTSDNPLIGVPLMYQYLVALRPDAIPTSSDNLLFHRGLGWLLSNYVPNPVPEPGVPLMTTYRWDTGVQAHGATRYVDASLAVTSGTLSNPRVDDDNDGRQWSGRVAFKPAIGLVLGASAARGEFLDRTIADFYKNVLPDAHYRQRALGFDAEYSRGYWIVRGELMDTRYNLPIVNRPFITNPLRATGGFIEGKYQLTPRYYVAARVDRLTFSNIVGVLEPAGQAGQPTPWDAPVSRVEAGVGARVTRHVSTRGVLQYDWRQGPVNFIAKQHFYASAQLSFWF
jgi:hypothetical protein